MFHRSNLLRALVGSLASVTVSVSTADAGLWESEVRASGGASIIETNSQATYSLFFSQQLPFSERQDRAYAPGFPPSYDHRGGVEISNFYGVRTDTRGNASMSITGDTLTMRVHSSVRALLGGTDGINFAGSRGSASTTFSFGFDFAREVRWTVASYSVDLGGGPQADGDPTVSARSIAAQIGSYAPGGVPNLDYRTFYSTDLSGNVQDNRTIYNGVQYGYYAGTTYPGTPPAIVGLSGSASSLNLSLNAFLLVENEDWRRIRNVADDVDIQISIRLDPIPSPSAATLLGLGGLLAARRRR